MVGAHLDSVAEGAGINDNGTGTAAILEIAQQLADVETTNAVRFAFSGRRRPGCWVRSTTSPTSPPGSARTSR